MNAAFKFVSTNRRVREDRRFVVGRGNFVADIKRDGMLHVAIVPSPHAAARIVSIDAAAALAVPGVHHVLTGAELAAAVDPMLNGLDTPRVRRYSLAVGQTRYSGEWIAAVVADTRAHRRGCGRAGRGRVRAAAARDRRRRKRSIPRARRSIPSTARTCCSTRPSCGARSSGISPKAPRQLSFRVTWGRSSTVPIETFGVLASWDPWHEMLDVWASIQMPKYAEQIARALRLPGQCGARALRRRRRRQLRREARHQAHRAGRAIWRASSAGRCG